MRSFFKKLIVIVFFLVALLVASIGFLEFLINHSEKSGHYLSGIVSTAFKKPITIGSAKITLFSRYPTITIHNAALLSEKTKNNLLHFASGQVTLNLLESLQKKEWALEKITLNNLKITLEANSASDHDANDALIHWLISQKSIVLNHVEINHCNEHQLCNPVLTFSAALTQQGKAQQITLSTGSNAQKTTLSTSLFLEKNKDHWQAILNNLIIQNKIANFAGNAIINFDLEKYFSLSAKGSGNLKDVSLSKIEAKYQKNTHTYKINAIANGGFFEKLFPGKLYLSISGNTAIIKTVFHNPNIAGSIIFNTKKNTPVKVDLQRLALNFKRQGNFSATIDPREIPAISASVNNFIINGENMGHLYWHSITTPNGIALQKAKLTNAFDKIALKGFWIQENRIQKIAVSGIFKSNDFGTWFQKIHHIARIKKGVLDLKFSLETQGDSNTLFELKNLKGQSTFKLKNLSIMDKDKKSDSANFFNSLLNLISLQSISSFLTLDFSAIKKSNEFKIFVMKADLQINNGYLKTKKTTLKSAVANIDFSGYVDFIHDQNNLKMVVYPNIIQSQPLGSCPVLFLFRLIIRWWKKITSYFLDPFFNLQYSITGTLEKPIVKHI